MGFVPLLIGVWRSSRVFGRVGSNDEQLVIPTGVSSICTVERSICRTNPVNCFVKVAKEGLVSRKGCHRPPLPNKICAITVYGRAHCRRLRLHRGDNITITPTSSESFQALRIRQTKTFDQHALVAIAVAVSLSGFVRQFLGLRGMHWSVTVAQLVATCIMTMLRVFIRRDLIHNPRTEKLESGYELDLMAREGIKNCKHWSVVTWGIRSAHL